MLSKYDALAEDCWRFVNATLRMDSGAPLPLMSHERLELYLLIAYASSQAALMRMSQLPFADAGARHLFPGAASLRGVSEAEWDAWTARARAAMRGLCLPRCAEPEAE